MNAPSISTLQSLNPAELQAAWQAAFGRTPPPRASRTFIIGNLSCTYQARLHRRARAVERRLMKLADALAENPDYRHKRRSKKLKPGTRLLRSWQGVVHEVTVEPEGFRHEATLYGSLSAIARHITGSRWSGPAFFGLNRKKMTDRG